MSQADSTEVMDSWADEGKMEGPWSFFEGQDLNGCHIAIDEAHLYWPVSARPNHVKRLRDWVSTVRHQGATIEFITQHHGQVASRLLPRVASGLLLTNLENEREPMGGCRVGDWLNVWAKFLRGNTVRMCGKSG